MKKGILILIAIATLCACSSKTFNDSDEVLAFIRNPDNGYYQTKTINGVNFSILYKPTDLLVDQELQNNFDSFIIDSLRNKYKKYIYFALSMSKNSNELLTNVASDRQRFGAMVNELAFGMDQKLHMYTSKKDTIPMADYIYPRMYGMSGSTTMLIVYPRETKIAEEEYINITIEDLGFNTGEVKFKIPTKKINNELKIDFK